MLLGFVSRNSLFLKYYNKQRKMLVLALIASVIFLLEKFDLCPIIENCFESIFVKRKFQENMKIYWKSIRDWGSKLGLKLLNF